MRCTGCWRRSARTWSLADHGFAGAAIEAGVETVSVADVNDPALLVAKAQGRTEVVVVMDDHVAADAYWPCFQAAAAAFPQVSRARHKGGLSGEGTLPLQSAHREEENHSPRLGC